MTDVYEPDAIIPMSDAKVGVQLVLRFMAVSVGLFLLCSCAVGYEDYLKFKNSRVGEIMPYKEPFSFSDAGKLIRADYVKVGQGLTHITKDEKGNLIYHFSDQEILENTRTEKEWVGKCLTYYVVDPETYIIKSWGFDKGGNPLSCRTWP
ncbi:hypothetical protein [Ferrimonas balearica]|uniref:hypothetical protein n=1 Tax=Ferrimonas balearica TaxID=44012 RepID=UPI001F3E14A9|nr:hypothetical protein [Ferrimonas balearica]MBY6096712.1 hypothetical protein [Ferrimonas balearica]